MATNQGYQACVNNNTNTEEDVNSLGDSFEKLNLSDANSDEEIPSADKQRGTKQSLGDAVGATKQEKHDDNKGSNPSSSGENGQMTVHLKTQKGRMLPPTPGTSNMQQPKQTTQNKEVLKTEKKTKDDGALPACLQESCKMIEVQIKGQGKSFGHKCEVTLTDYLKYKFLEIDIKRTSEKVKQKLNIELSFNSKRILVLTFSEARQQFENTDSVMKRIFESIDDVEVNSVQLCGLDLLDLEDKIVTEFKKQDIKFFSEPDEETEILVYIYLKKDVKKVDNVIQLLLKNTSGKQDAKVVIKKEDSLYLNENECTEEFCIVYKSVFNLEEIEKKYGIQFESSDITVDEEKHLIQFRLGRNWKGNKEKGMQILKEITEKYPANTVSFQDINCSEMESTNHLCVYLESYFSGKLKKIKENDLLLWYINEKARKVSVATCSQPDTDEIAQKVKSCLLYKEIDVTDDVKESQNFETLGDVIAKMNENNHGQCICSMKDNRISIWGLKDGVEDAERNLKEELEEREKSNHKHGNGLPVSETNENNDPDKESSKKEIKTKQTDLSDMIGNDPKTESNAPMDDTLTADKNDDVTNESDKPENGTPKIRYKYDVAFKPNSKNALHLLLKQGELDDLKAKYKMDIEIIPIGVILKITNMAHSEDAKTELTKREQSFKFVKKSLCLSYMQKDDMDKAISDIDLADVVVCHDESGVPGPTKKQNSKGRRWSYSKGHEIVLIDGHLEYHWEELMIDIVLGNGKPDGPKQYDDDRWKATLYIHTEEENKGLHSLAEDLGKMLRDKRVQEYRKICLSLEPVGDLPKIKYGKMLFHTLQRWLESKTEPVSIHLCAPESYESHIRGFNLALKTYSFAENTTVETTTGSVSLTMIGLENSNFQQAEEKIRELAKKIKLKKMKMTKGDEEGDTDHGAGTTGAYEEKKREIADTMEALKEQIQAEQNSKRRVDTQERADEEAGWKNDKNEELFTPETYLIYKNPGSLEKIKKELSKLETHKIVNGQSFKEILVICQNEKDAQKLIDMKRYGAQRLKKTGLGLKTMKINKVQLPDDKKKRLKEAQVRVFGKNNDILQAPTLLQISFAKSLIESDAVVKDLSDSGRTAAKQKKDTPVNSDTVKIQGAPELVYELLKIQEKLGKLNTKGVKIEYSEGCLHCPLALKATVDHFMRMTFEDVALSKKEKDLNVNAFCEDINKDKELCVYDSGKGRVILFADSYEDLQKVKHQLSVKLERIRPTGRRGNRKITADNTSPQSSLRPANVPVLTDFVWDKDAKNIEVFKTKEGLQVYVYEASIIKLPVDCIVNAANDTMMHGGGIALVIARAAGRSLESECSAHIRKSGCVQVGGNIVTTAGNLPYRCVIHAVGPRWSDYKPHSLDEVKACEQDLQNAVYGSLVAAERCGLKTIALPAISSAIFGVPEQLCVYQYAKATLKYSKNSAGKDSSLTEVHFIDINADIVKKIQEMFITMVRDEKNPGYDSQEFVSRRSSGSSHSRNHGPSKQSNLQQPQHQYSNVVQRIEDNHRFQGNLHVHKEDLFLLKVKQKTAVVMFVDDSLKPHGQVAVKLVKSMRQSENYYYAKEKKEKREKHGSTFLTKGYGCGFNHIIHVVSQGFKNTKSTHEKKTQVMVVYGSILDLALKVRHIDAVVMTLIRVGGAQDDTKLSSEALKKCYDDRNIKIAERNLEVHIVCNDERVHVVFSTMDMKPHVPPSPRREPVTPYPGGYPSTSNIRGYPSTSNPGSYPSTSTSEVWNNNNQVQQGAYASMTDNRRSGGGDGDVREDGNGAYREERGAAGSEDRGHGDGEEKKDGEENNCVICMDKMDDDSTTLWCGHSFCTGCIDQQFKYKEACPTCGAVCGIITGDQPDGKMNVYTNKYQHCAGYSECGCIEITYNFPSGRQGPNHPSPGTWYKGITRTAYLPDNKEGREICEMLIVAFDRKLVFTIGRSTTTGQEGVITWNDIHHKTDPNPFRQFGYPDDTYLSRVREELAAKGITPKDIPSASSSH